MQDEIKKKPKKDLYLMANTNDNLNMTRYGKDLHVFTPDEHNLTKSFDQFSNLFAMRTRKSREYWLLDITDFGLEVAKQKLNNLPTLDLDDDLYLFEGKHVLKLWEFYEINKDLPRVCNPYATWSSEDGLQVINKSKWIRRRNLQVNLYLMKFIITTY